MSAVNLENLTLKPHLNANNVLDVGAIHYLPEKGAYYAFVGFVELYEKIDPVMCQVWVTNSDNPYGAALESEAEWDKWLEVYARPSNISKNVFIAYENTVLINPVKIQIECLDYIEEYVKLIESRHRERYNKAPRSFTFEGMEDMFTFTVLLEGRISRKPFIDRILESLE